MKKLFAVLLALLLLSGCAAQNGTPADGEYTVEASLTGGSGRAGIQSPARLAIKDGRAEATIVWSSPFYEWMRVDGVLYAPLQTEGNSTFIVPVALDKDIQITAQTVAMSQPHEVEYSLRFESSTLKETGEE